MTHQKRKVLFLESSSSSTTQHGEPPGNLRNAEVRGTLVGDGGDLAEFSLFRWCCGLGKPTRYKTDNNHNNSHRLFASLRTEDTDYSTSYRRTNEPAKDIQKK